METYTRYSDYSDINPSIGESKSELDYEIHFMEREIERYRARKNELIERERGDVCTIVLRMGESVSKTSYDMFGEIGYAENTLYEKKYIVGTTENIDVAKKFVETHRFKYQYFEKIFGCNYYELKIVIKKTDKDTNPESSNIDFTEFGERFRKVPYVDVFTKEVRIVE